MALLFTIRLGLSHQLRFMYIVMCVLKNMYLLFGFVEREKGNIFFFPL